jgi:UDP-N-acetylglucosamine 1-carboxyvinyltransferase
MAHLVIEGGRQLAGHITVEGNKNAALPLLAACLLTTETCEIRNVPRIRDVAVMVALLRSLGAEVEGDGTSTLRVTCRDIRSSEPDAAMVGKLRGSVLLLGALVGRVGGRSLRLRAAIFRRAARSPRTCARSWRSARASSTTRPATGSRRPRA